MRKNLKYMHTLDGQPAYYVPGEQICFSGCGPHNAVRLVDSIKEIHRQQWLSKKWRHSKGWKDNRNHGWVYVSMPNAAGERQPPANKEKQ